MEEVVYTVECPHCHQKNKVRVMKNDAFNEREEIWCAWCGLEMGAVSAAEPPSIMRDESGKEE